MNKKTSIAAIVLAVSGAAGAQAVYRCGSSYGQQPCPGGSEVAATAPRPAADVAQARSVAQADMKRADAMEKARLAQEKQAPKALVIGPQAAASAPAKTVAHAKKKGKQEEFTAVQPGTAPVRCVIPISVVTRPASASTILRPIKPLAPKMTTACGNALMRHPPPR